MVSGSAPTLRDEVLLRTKTQALIRVIGKHLGPHAAEEFVTEWLRILASESEVQAITPHVAPEARRAQREGVRDALAWLQDCAPVLLASIPRRGKRNAM